MTSSKQLKRRKNRSDEDEKLDLIFELALILWRQQKQDIIKLRQVADLLVDGKDFQGGCHDTK